MSDTPRTDMFCRTVDHTAIVGGKIYQATIETVDASLARQLETELSEARAEIERLKGVIISQITPEPFVLSSYSATAEPAKDKRDKLIKQMREALKACAEFIHYYDQEHNIGDGKVLEQAIAALSAAERGEG